jgi:transposase InsO family protein
MRYGLIEKERANHSVKRLCVILRVAESGYYAWKKRSESPRFKENTVILADIQRVYNENKGRYGSKRIHKQLKNEQRGCSRGRIERLMRRYEIRAKNHKKFKVTTTDSNHNLPIAPNLLEQKFVAKHPNHVWLADITYIPTNEGWLYLATVLDLYSRKIVGWSMRDHMRTELPLAALMMATQRQKITGELIHHSDRGVQYASHDYRNALKTANITQSMSRKGNCYDILCFFGTSRILLQNAQNRTRLSHHLQNQRGSKIRPIQIH